MAYLPEEALAAKEPIFFGNNPKLREPWRRAEDGAQSRRFHAYPSFLEDVGSNTQYGVRRYTITIINTGHQSRKKYLSFLTGHFSVTAGCSRMRRSSNLPSSINLFFQPLSSRLSTQDCSEPRFNDDNGNCWCLLTRIQISIAPVTQVADCRASTTSFILRAARCRATSHHPKW